MSAPVKPTCPDIDKIIKCLRSAIKVCQNGEKEFKGEAAFDYFWEVLYEIEDLEDALEKLRSDNSSLRAWGYELEQQLKELNAQSL